MKVILLNDVKKVGKKGDVVEVSDGYGRNFLIARGLAVASTAKSMEILADQKEAQRIEDEKQKAAAEELAERMNKMILTFPVKSGKEGRVFGSVSTKQIVEALNKQGIRVDKHKFLDTAPIVSLGVTKVRIELYKGVVATIGCQLKGTE